MPGPSIVIAIAEDQTLARDLSAGGVFVVGCTLGLNEDCELVVIGDRELRLPGRVVFVDARGAGIEVVGFTGVLKQELAALVATAPLPAPPAGALEESADGTDAISRIKDVKQREVAATLHQRLRGLTLAEAVKRALSTDPTERMLLERMYGKNVWEPLLRNPRITVPEVTRIARMGTLPRPLVEVIVSNGAWIQIPEIRRALLSNGRLALDQILRVLRVMPKPELKTTGSTASYSHAVRDAAKRLFARPSSEVRSGVGSPPCVSTARPDQLRALEIIPHYQKHAEGSALIKLGDTWVLCAASVEAASPRSSLARVRAGSPPSTRCCRARRTRAASVIRGRGKEIQRLIGRSLRTVFDLGALGERTITLDCDVLQADGGTRVASITGAWVALALAIDKLVAAGSLADARALKPPVAAVSVGVVGGEVVLDLPYVEDSKADVDMNVVGGEDGTLIEVQGTAEHGTFDRKQLDAMLDLATLGLAQLAAAQRKIVGR